MDFKKHIEKAKDIGLKNVEQSLKDLLSDVIKPMAEDYIVESENKVDDVLLPFLGEVEKAVNGILDKVHQPEEEVKEEAPAEEPKAE